jgi:hypothetical protein
MRSKRLGEFAHVVITDRAPAVPGEKGRPFRIAGRKAEDIVGEDQLGGPAGSSRLVCAHRVVPVPAASLDP